MEWVEPAGVTVLYDEASARSRRARSPTLTAGGGRGAAAVRSEPPDGSACFAPELTHAEFAWSKAAVVDPARAGRHRRQRSSSAVAFYERKSRFSSGSPSASRLAAAGYMFLINKYYLDALYEKVIVGAHRRADRQRP